MAYELTRSGNNYLSAGTDLVFNVKNNDFSFSLNFRCASVSLGANNLQTVLSLFQGSSAATWNGFSLFVEQASLKFNTYINSGSPNSTTSAAVADNTLYRATVRRSSNSVYLSVNNVTTGPTTFTSSFADNSSFIIGSWPTFAAFGNYTLGGIVSDVGFWNVALTDSEVASLAVGFTPDQIRPQSVQFYAPLIRDLIDVRGARIITNINGATPVAHPRIIT